MAIHRSAIKMLVYLFISVILPVALILINHIFWIDNVVLTAILMVWMGFALLIIQPYSIGEYKTIEP